VVPVLPPANDPLVVSYDIRGHRQLPRVSDAPLSVDDGRVMKLIEHHPMVRALHPFCLFIPIQLLFPLFR
jgi:hypothetical protein